MSNMSYCRFENTVPDLEDCLEHINDDLSDPENEARKRLVSTCVLILEELGYFIQESRPKKDWTGCRTCFGSGGKRNDPCKVCGGTGRIAK